MLNANNELVVLVMNTAFRQCSLALDDLFWSYQLPPYFVFSFKWTYGIWIGDSLGSFFATCWYMVAWTCLIFFRLPCSSFFSFSLILQISRWVFFLVNIFSSFALMVDYSLVWSNSPSISFLFACLCQLLETSDRGVQRLGFL